MMGVVFEVNSVCLWGWGGIGKVFKGPNLSELPQQCSHKLCCSVLQATHTYIHVHYFYWQKIIYMHVHESIHLYARKLSASLCVVSD